MFDKTPAKTTDPGDNIMLCPVRFDPDTTFSFRRNAVNRKRRGVVVAVLTYSRSNLIPVLPAIVRIRPAIVELPLSQATQNKARVREQKIIIKRFFPQNKEFNKEIRANLEKYQTRQGNK